MKKEITTVIVNGEENINKMLNKLFLEYKDDVKELVTNGFDGDDFEIRVYSASENIRPKISDFVFVDDSLSYSMVMLFKQFLKPKGVLIPYIN